MSCTLAASSLKTCQPSSSPSSTGTFRLKRPYRAWGSRRDTHGIDVALRTSLDLFSPGPASRHIRLVDLLFDPLHIASLQPWDIQNQWTTIANLLLMHHEHESIDDVPLVCPHPKPHEAATVRSTSRSQGPTQGTACVSVHYSQAIKLIIATTTLIAGMRVRPPTQRDGITLHLDPLPTRG